MPHPHTFDEADWPFEDATNTRAFSTKYVIHEGYPILTIAHDHDGDWQFLCGTTVDPKEMSIVSAPLKPKPSRC